MKSIFTVHNVQDLGPLDFPDPSGNFTTSFTTKTERAYSSPRDLCSWSDYESPKAQKEAERIHGAPRVKVIIKK